VSARYLLTITSKDAALLERWLGGRLQVIPAPDPLDTPGTVTVAGLDAVTDDEYEVIARRLRTSGPLYHAGGPG
jgi:hypothetical protein